ncbi:MAG: ComF family protein [Lachnospiraceae bacterium]|nr:ComF family protein [Lachnospiraceae bacterium]
MELYERTLDLFFPKRCPVCDDIVNEPGKLICDECREELKLIGDPYCLKCGRPVRDPAMRLCELCREKEEKYRFVKGRAVFEYDDVLKESIYRFKYGGRKEYGEYYAKVMAEALGDQILSWQPQAFIPIPLHKRRYNVRGYNQASVIAEKLSEILGIPVREDILIRSENTRKQKELSVSQRENNLKKALKIKHYDVKLKNIVLVDDIYTTGSTIDVAAACLIDKGAENIYYSVIGAAAV